MQNGPAYGLVVIVANGNGQHGAKAEHAAGNGHAYNTRVKAAPSLLATTAGNVFTTDGVSVLIHALAALLANAAY